jgi:hypothetical protein
VSFPRLAPLGDKPSAISRAVNHLLALQPNEDTAANIASATATVNVVGKFSGKMVWDTTNNRMLRASGKNPTDAWWILDGSASVTPV